MQLLDLGRDTRLKKITQVKLMEPAMFSVASMFAAESDEDGEDALVERDHSFPGMVLHIREFAFHQVNANLLWPGSIIFAEWIVKHKDLIKGRRVLELGSGTGGLAIFLKRTLELDITTSDYDDVQIQYNIEKNCRLNGLETLPHIRHTWGQDFPCANPDWDLIIASDILLYVKQYPNLIHSLTFLLTGYSRELGTAQGPKQECLVTKVYVTENVINNGSCSISKSSVQSTESLSIQSANLINESQTSVLESRSIANVCLPGSVSDPPSLVNYHQGSNLHASPKSVKPTLAHISELPRPCFLMSWRRRIPKEDEALFFNGCRTAGFVVVDFGSRVYCIHQPM